MAQHPGTRTDTRPVEATNGEIMTLVDRIRGFDFDLASTADQLALSKALKIVSDDTLARHAAVVEMQGELTRKLAVAEVAGELAGVCASLRHRAPARALSFRGLLGYRHG